MKELKLYCLPCAGGSTALYKDWKGFGINVCPIELSGRGIRFNEPLYHSMDDAVNDIFQLIDTRGPYAFFGHSMGSILCYELLLRLQKEHHPSPEHVFFSAANPPEIKPYCDYASMPDDILAEEIYRMGGVDRAIIEDGKLMKIFLTIFRADFYLLSSYNQDRDFPLVDCSISVLFGDDDPGMVWRDLRMWRRYTIRNCEFKVFSGNHFYLNKNKESLFAYIQSRLKDYYDRIR